MTAQTATLTDFLLARIAEDEAAARAATPGHWAAGRREVMHGTCSPGQQVLGPNGVVSPAQADVTHIARHDPARVLAECEAKRRIVKFHESWPVLVETPPEFEPSDPTDLQSMTFRVSQQIAWMTAQQYRERFGDESPAGPVLRALASVYADHPDFREEWRA